jgi:purine-cytosine permease-like protein
MQFGAPALSGEFDMISFLDALEKFRKATISFVMSVCLSVCLSVRLSVRMEHFDSQLTGYREILCLVTFFQNLSRKFKYN